MINNMIDDLPDLDSLETIGNLIKESAKKAIHLLSEIQKMEEGPEKNDMITEYYKIFTELYNYGYDNGELMSQMYTISAISQN